MGAQYQYVDFPDVIKFNVAVHTTQHKSQNHASMLRRAPNTEFPVAVHMLWEKAIWNLDYDPDRAQNLISSSMSIPTPVDTQNLIEIHARVFTDAM